MADKVKVTVNLTKAEVDELRKQAREDGITLTDALRRAIAVGRIAYETRKNHGKLLTEDSEGRYRQIEVIG